VKIDARAILLGAVAAAAAFVVFRGGGRGSTSDSDPESAIPKDSFLAATIDLAELRRSPVYDALFGKDGSGANNAFGVGVTKLLSACGFDPLGRVSKIAVAVPEEGNSGEIGIAAKISVSRDEIARCTSAISKAEPKRVGSFGVVESEGPGAPRPRIAYGKEGLLVAGRGAWFDAMLGSAEGTHAGLADAKEHAAIRASLTARDGWGAPTVLASALLPAELRERLRREMRAELGSSDASAAAMGGVLGVSGVGVAMRTTSRTEAAAELVCDTADACSAVEKLIQKKRFDLGKELSLRMIGLGPVIDSIVTEIGGGGKRLRVTASADSRQLADTLERILRWKARREARGDGRGDALVPPPPPAPNETLRAKPDGGSDGSGRSEGGPPLQ
jgi:hypothetical protein